MPRGLLNTGGNKRTFENHTPTNTTENSRPKNNIQNFFGDGNPDVSNEDIRIYTNKPGVTDLDILNKALETGVSGRQLSLATNDPRFNIDNINNFAASRGVTEAPAPAPSLDNTARSTAGTAAYTAAPEVKSAGFSGSTASQASTERSDPYTYDGVLSASTRDATYDPASFVRAVQDPIKGTVAGQLNGILNTNSPLMKKAETYGRQKASRRGLLNSSLAATAAQDAMIGAGLQIATPDAQSYNTFALTNAQEANNTNRFNSDLGAKVGMFNADQSNQTSKFNADQGNKVGMFNADLTTNNNQFNADQENQTSRFNADLDTSNNQFNAGEKNKIGMFNSDLDARNNQFNADQSNRVGMFNSDLSTRNSQFNADQDNRVGMFNAGVESDLLKNREALEANKYIAELDTDTKLAIAEVQALSADSKLAASLNDTMIRGIVDIGRDANLSPDRRQELTNQLINETQRSIALVPSFDTPEFKESIIFPENATSDSGDKKGSGTLEEDNVTTTAGYELSQIEKNIANTLRERGVAFDEKKIITKKEIDDAGGLNEENFPGARNLVGNEAFDPLYVRP